jgi:hypothetical protein
VAERLAVPVRPLIVVHGRGLRRRGRRCGGVRVVPANGLLRRLERGHRRLYPAEIADLGDRVETIFGSTGGALEKRATRHG